MKLNVTYDKEIKRNSYTYKIRATDGILNSTETEAEAERSASESYDAHLADFEDILFARNNDVSDLTNNSIFKTNYNSSNHLSLEMDKTTGSKMKRQVTQLDGKPFLASEIEFEIADDETMYAKYEFEPKQEIETNKLSKENTANFSRLTFEKPSIGNDDINEIDDENDDGDLDDLLQPVYVYGENIFYENPNSIIGGQASVQKATMKIFGQTRQVCSKMIQMFLTKSNWRKQDQTAKDFFNEISILKGFNL